MAPRSWCTAAGCCWASVDGDLAVGAGGFRESPEIRTAGGMIGGDDGFADDADAGRGDHRALRAGLRGPARVAHGVGRARAQGWRWGRVRQRLWVRALRAIG